MTPEDIANIFVIGLVVFMGIATLVLTQEAQARLDNPDDTSIVYLHQLESLALLTNDAIEYRVEIVRQSGYPHSASVYYSRDAAIRSLAATLRRAKIEAVVIRSNIDGYLNVYRLYHNHRGSSEGKRVGGGSIMAIWGS
ncbi:MAG: hypothetical protein K2X31_03235 [Sphingopyxis sp.]|nr:hypothetical protein [Sphingopyxis sp.]